MSYEALIERFDRHMVRIDEELRLTREAHERHVAVHEDHREFIREMTLRLHHDRDAMITTLNAQTDAMRTELAALRAEDREQRAQLRANTQAVLRLLDRFGPPTDGTGSTHG